MSQGPWTEVDKCIGRELGPDDPDLAAALRADANAGMPAHGVAATRRMRQDRAVAHRCAVPHRADHREHGPKEHAQPELGPYFVEPISPVGWAAWWSIKMMHEGEVHVDVALVRQLLTEQFPDRGQSNIREVRSTGTVNSIYRVGEDTYARLPRLAEWEDSLLREVKWLPWLAERLSLPIPTPIGLGRPSASYPLAWALYRWQDGEPYTDAGIGDETQAARDVARFVLELRGLDTAGAPPAGRRPLRQLDRETRAAMEASRMLIDSETARLVWDDAIESPAWDGAAVWIHADLLRPNILTSSGRVGAIIDFGSAGVGDPAADVIAAWSVFGPAGREEYRSALNVDGETWRRARGFALHQAVIAIPYYAETNPRFASLAQRTVEQVILEFAESR